MSHGQPCTLIIASGSTNNLVAREMVEKLGLKRLKHPTPYRVQWLQEGHQLLVDEQCEVEFHIDEYKDKVICDIMSMNVCDILLGRPWQYDRDAVYFGKKNYYKVYKDGIKRKLVPIKDEETAGTSETRSPFLKQVESPKEKVTDIKPTTEKAAEEEVPVSSPAEEVPAAEKTVDEIPATVEKSAEESTVTPPASEPEAVSAPVESEEVEKPKEESAPAAEEAESAKEETVAQPPAEAAAVEEKSSDKEEAPPAIETAAEEKAEESLVKEEAPAEIPEKKTATVEESAVKPAEAAPAEEKAEVEGKAEE